MKENNNLTILAIETSCDDTCCAVLEIKNKKLNLLSNIVSSQVKLHAKYGGIYPTLAKREHQRNLPLVLKKALKKTEISLEKIDLIAVTNGPGLDPCLWVGVNFAKDLAQNWKIPLIPINHIEGHIYANWLLPINRNSKSKILNSKHIQFPAICLIVSGGHTQLILMQGPGKYKILGETRDDAAGECFDKTARILGLGYPGGPAIADKAKDYRGQTLVNLPRPMIHQKNYDFSFSGLKTAVLYDYKKQSVKIKKSKKYIQAMAAEIQQAIIDVLIKKTIKATKEYKTKSIILGGGVIANKELQKQFRKKIEKEIPDANLYIPSNEFCTDNAAMIAVTAHASLARMHPDKAKRRSKSEAFIEHFHWLKKKNQKPKIEVNANLRL